MSLTVTLSGDLLWHRDLMASMRRDAKEAGSGEEFAFSPLMDGLRPVISGADLSVCHEEVPFAKPGGPYTAFPIFAAPPQAAKAIADTGFDICTTASNHSLDGGFEGLVRTLDGLHAQNITTVGTRATPSDAPVIVKVKGVSIGIVSGTYHLNGFSRPADKPWSVDLLDVDRMKKDAAKARSAGADIVLAHVHAGTEYVTAPDSQQKSVFAALAASPDIDLVYGQGAHVVQPITKVNGKWVVYGHGDLVSTGRVTVPRVYDGMITRFTFSGVPGERFTVAKAEYIPTVVSTIGGKVRVHQVSAALPNATGALKDRLQLGQQRVRSAALSLGVTDITEA